MVDWKDPEYADNIDAPRLWYSSCACGEGHSLRITSGADLQEAFCPHCGQWHNSPVSEDLYHTLSDDYWKQVNLLVNRNWPPCMVGEGRDEWVAR